MKKWLLKGFLVIGLLSSCVKNFEGIITYQATYESKKKGVTTEEMFGQKTSRDTTYIKDGFYLNKSTTSFMCYQLWRSKDTTIYFRNNSSLDTIWFQKTNFHSPSIDSALIEINAEEVLGYKCNKLTVYRNKRIFTYFYHPNFKLSPKYYREYSTSAKFEIMKLMKSPYLRLTIHSPTGANMDMIAVDINITKVSDSIFAIPNGTLVKFDM